MLDCTHIFLSDAHGRRSRDAVILQAQQGNVSSETIKRSIEAQKGQEADRVFGSSHGKTRRTTL